jgi:hypothetical protein
MRYAARTYRPAEVRVMARRIRREYVRAGKQMQALMREQME